jgi:UDP-N-acetylenolpyruvoylglucosamine reductase
MNNIIDLLEKLKIPYKTAVPLSKYTTFKIGGTADVIAFPETPTQVAELMKADVPNRILGLGSNILAPDGRVEELIIKYSEASLSIKDGLICAKAGAKLSEVCRFARDNALTGLEFAFGIPGSIGGAVYMNAGAYGGEMKDVVRTVEYIDTDGKLNTLEKEQLELSYRRSFFSGKGYIITSVLLELAAGNKDEITEKMNDFLACRKEKQPLDLPSAGSTFKRPPNGYASAMIDECGLKGKSVGGAAVSEKHAGFVVNTGGATQKDVLELIDIITEIVGDKKRIKLEPEIEIWNF